MDDVLPQIMTEYRVVLIAAACFKLRPTNYQSNGYASLRRRYHRVGVLNLAGLHALAVRTYC